MYSIWLQMFNLEHRLAFTGRQLILDLLLLPLSFRRKRRLNICTFLPQTIQTGFWLNNKHKNQLLCVWECLCALHSEHGVWIGTHPHLCPQVVRVNSIITHFNNNVTLGQDGAQERGGHLDVRLLLEVHHIPTHTLKLIFTQWFRLHLWLILHNPI